MTCASCAAVIEKTLKDSPGVTKATVNLAANTGTVEFDPAVIGIDELITAVEHAGYDAVVKGDRIPGQTGAVDVQAEAQAKAHKHERNMFIFSLALSIPALPHLDGPAVHDGRPAGVADWLAVDLRRHVGPDDGREVPRVPARHARCSSSPAPSSTAASGTRSSGAAATWTR